MKIPSFLSHLPVYGEYPIPFVVYRDANGKPDFRVSDLRKQIECYRNCLCAICGNVMVYGNFWFIGGPKSITSGHFTDGPMHLACAQFSAKICPFLNSTRQQTSNRLVHCTGKIIIHENVDTVRPERMAIRRARYYEAMTTAQGGIFYIVKSWYGNARWF